MTQAEIEAIVMAEFRYWSRDEVPGEIGIPAVGAAANIFAAIKGFPAPWHPKQSKEPVSPCPKCGGDKRITLKNLDDPSQPDRVIECPACKIQP